MILIEMVKKDQLFNGFRLFEWTLRRTFMPKKAPQKFSAERKSLV